MSILTNLLKGIVPSSPPPHTHTEMNPIVALWTSCLSNLKQQAAESGSTLKTKTLQECRRVHVHDEEIELQEYSIWRLDDIVFQIASYENEIVCEIESAQFWGIGFFVWNMNLLQGNHLKGWMTQYEEALKDTMIYLKEQDALSTTLDSTEQRSYQEAAYSA